MRWSERCSNVCSICGFVARKSRLSNILRMTEIMLSASDRGRDSYGIITNAGSIFGIGNFTDDADIKKLSPLRRATWGIANLRAEPTTEYIAEKRLMDVQPFQYGKVFVSHNGTIANDDELKSQ